MFKKLVLTSAILTLSSAAFAGTYLAGDLGISNPQYSANNVVTNSGSNFNVDLGGKGALFNIAGGYGGLINSSVYLGGELFVNADTASAKAQEVFSAGNTLTNKVRTKYSCGIDFMPGVLFTDKAMVYARLGVVKTRFDAKLSGTDINGNSVSTGENNSVAGARFGLGLQTKVTEKVDIRTEYVYSDYRSVNLLGTQYNPTGGQATVGFVYNID